METIRVFIAIKIDLNPKLKGIWQVLRHRLAGERIRWIPEKNLHITLRFIGDLLPDQVEAVKAELKDICNDCRSFSFKLDQIGVFKHRGSPSVLFFKVDDTDELIALAGVIRTRLEKKGITSNKKFRPHLTLARITQINDLSNFYDAVKSFQNTPTQEVKVNQVIFYESILKPAGGEYRIIEEYELNQRN